MKKKLVEILKKSSMNYISKTGSLALYGEKKVPEDMVKEYQKLKK